MNIKITSNKNGDVFPFCDEFNILLFEYFADQVNEFLIDTMYTFTKISFLHSVGKLNKKKLEKLENV